MPTSRPGLSGGVRPRPWEGWVYTKDLTYKLQLDYRQLENKANDREDDEVRLQYQLIF